MSGVIEAKAVSQNGGEIDLEGGSGATNVSGTLTATASKGTGGTIAVTGHAVTLTQTAQIDASGATGGTVAVGGGVHGGAVLGITSLTQAQAVTVAPGAMITADGSAGAGGTISVWTAANDGSSVTRVGGALSATGATVGGLIETSGDSLNIDGIRVKAGNWLLDPISLELTDNDQANINAALAAGTNVTLSTSASGAPTGGFGTQDTTDTNGDIIVDAAGGSAPSGISWSTAATLSLNSVGELIVPTSAEIVGTGSGSLIATAATGTSISGSLAAGFVALTDEASLTFASGAAVTTSGNLQLLSPNIRVEAGATLTGGATQDIYSNDSGTFGAASHVEIAGTLTAGGVYFYTGTITTDSSSSITGTTTVLFSAQGGTSLNGSISAGNASVTDSTSVSGAGTASIAGAYVLQTPTTSLLPGGKVTFGAGGSLTFNGQAYTLITDEAQLQAISNGGFYAVANDFSAAGSPFTPIPVFDGALLGLGHTISGLSITASSGVNVGLFGALGYGGFPAEITNLTLSNVSISGTGSVANTTLSSNVYDMGALAGYFGDGLIYDVSVSGTVVGTGVTAVGGLIGDTALSGGTGTISTSSSSATVSDSNSDTSAGAYLGGLIGGASESITLSYATGTVSASGAGFVYTGGLVGGFQSSTISYSYATGSVEGVYYVGGFVGVNGNGTVGGSLVGDYATGSVGGVESVGGLVGGDYGGLISQTYATGAVAGLSLVGGLAGFVDEGGTVGQSWASGTVIGTGTGLGGLVGSNGYTGLGAGTITDSYAIGAVSGTSGVSTQVGGLVGINFAGSILNSYATGATIGASGQTGGFAGENDGAITDGYWDADVEATGIGLESGTATGSGLTLAALEAALPSGLSSSVWGDGSGQATPYLLNNGGPAYFAGLGTTPFIAVTTAAQLEALPSNGNFALVASLDLSSIANFTPIGYSSANTNLTPTAFTGIFDGLGYSITGLTITDATDYDLGLFSQIGASGVVENLGVSGTLTVTANDNFGLLAGVNEGTVSDSFATGSINGSTATASTEGGLVGLNQGGQIDASYANVAVVGEASLGGLVGQNAGTITDSYAVGSVSGTGFIGGLVGINSGTVITSYAVGSVTGTTATGGLVGLSQTGTETDSYWDTQTSGTSTDGGAATGLTTAQLTAALPTGFSSTVWTASANTTVLPSLNWQATQLPVPGTGITDDTLTGLVYTNDLETTALSGVSVSIVVDGQAISLASGGTTNSAGSVSLSFASTAVAAGAHDMVLYLSSGTTHGSWFQDAVSFSPGSPLTFQIDGGTAFVETSGTTVSGAVSLIHTAVGASGLGVTQTVVDPTPATGLSVPDGNLIVDFTGNFSIDQAISTATGGGNLGSLGDLVFDDFATTAASVTQSAALTAPNLYVWGGSTDFVLTNTGNAVGGVFGNSFAGSNGYQLAGLTLTDALTNGLSVDTLYSTGSVSIDATGGGITVGAATSSPSVSTTSALSLKTIGAITLDGAIASAGPITLTTGSGATTTQTATATITTGSLDLEGGSYTLNTAPNLVGGLTAGTLGAAGSVSLQNNGATPLTLGSAGNNVASLQLTGLSGDLALAGNVTVTGSGGVDLAPAATGASDLVVAANVTIDATGSGAPLTLGSVDADLAANNRALTLDDGTGTVTLGAIGNSQALGGLTVNAATIDLSNDVTTTAAQNLNGAVTLTGNADLTGAAVTFGSTVSGPYGLTVSAPVTLGGNVTTTGAAQDYTGAVTLTTATDFTGSSVTFGSTVTGPYALTATAPVSLGGNVTTTGAAQDYTGVVTLAAAADLTGSAVTFGASVSGPYALTVSAPAALGGNVTTTGAAQDYTGAVTLAAAVDLTGSAVTFGSTVNGPFALTLSAPTTIGGNVTTTGAAQDYTGAVTLAAAADLTGSSVTFGSTVNGPYGLTVSALASIGGDVTTTGAAQDYTGPVTLSAATDLTGSSVTFASTVNGSFGLTVSAPVTLGGDVTTSGAAQDYTGAVTLTTATDFTGSSVTYGSTVTGPYALTVSGAAGIGGNITTPGAAQTFTGAVSLSAAADLTGSSVTFGSTVTGPYALTVGAPASIGGDVTTSGAPQDYTGAVNLSAAADLTGSAVTFGSTVDGPYGLTVSAPATLGGNVTTTGAAQVYSDAVTLTTATDFTGANVAFGSTVSGPDALTVSAPATIGGDVTTAGAAQTYDGATTLSAAANLTGASVTFGSTVTGPYALTVAAPATFGGNVTTAGAAQDYTGAITLSSAADLTGSSVTFGSTVSGPHALTVTAPATIGGDITTTGAPQEYLGTVTLAAPANLAGSTIMFGSSVNSPYALSMTAPISLAGTITAPSFSATTATLAATASIVTSADNGTITIGTLDGAFDLTLNAGTGTVSLGNIGATAPLAGLAITGGSVALAGVQLSGSLTIGTNALNVTGTVAAAAGVNLTTQASGGSIGIGAGSGTLAVSSVLLATLGSGSLVSIGDASSIVSADGTIAMPAGTTLRGATLTLGSTADLSSTGSITFATNALSIVSGATAPTATGVTLTTAAPGGAFAIASASGTQVFSYAQIGFLGTSAPVTLGDGTNAITIGGTVSVANGLVFDGSLVLTAASGIAGGAGAITFDGSVNAQSNGTGVLDPTAGLTLGTAGNILFNQDLGTPVRDSEGNVVSTAFFLPYLDITGADNVTVSSAQISGTPYYPGLFVHSFDGVIANTLNTGQHSLESDGDVSIIATTVEGRIVAGSTPPNDTLTIQAQSVDNVTASGGVIQIAANTINNLKILSVNGSIGNDTITANSVSNVDVNATPQMTPNGTEVPLGPSGGDLVVNAGTIDNLDVGSVGNPSVRGADSVLLQAPGGTGNLQVTNTSINVGVANITAATIDTSTIITQQNATVTASQSITNTTIVTGTDLGVTTPQTSADNFDAGYSPGDTLNLDSNTIENVDAGGYDVNVEANLIDDLAIGSLGTPPAIGADTVSLQGIDGGPLQVSNTVIDAVSGDISLSTLDTSHIQFQDDLQFAASQSVTDSTIVSLGTGKVAAETLIGSDVEIGDAATQLADLQVPTNATNPTVQVSQGGSIDDGDQGSGGGTGKGEGKGSKNGSKKGRNNGNNAITAGQSGTARVYDYANQYVNGLLKTKI
jgi:hypothetical protein